MKSYEDLQMEMILFDTQDVITTSTGKVPGKSGDINMPISGT